MRNSDYDYVVSTRARGRVQGRTRGLSKATVERGIRKEYRDEGVKKVTVRKVKNGLLSNLRMIKAHDKRAIQGAGLQGRLKAIDEQIRDVTVDPFYRKEKHLQALTLKRLKERRKELQAQIKKNPDTANRAAWRKGYEHGYKGLNSRPDYSKVGLAGSYRLGYEAGEKRRKGKAQPRRNPKAKTTTELKQMQLIAQHAQIAAEAVKQRYGYGSAKHVTAEKAYKTASQRYQRAKNPKRETKTSKDAFGVTHENPSNRRKYFAGFAGQYHESYVPYFITNRGRHTAMLRKGYEFVKAIKYPSENEPSTNVYTKDGATVHLNNKGKITLNYPVTHAAPFKNPSVTAIAEKFQGGVDGAIEEFHAASSAPANLARAGKLVFLKVGAKTFRLPGAMVAIAPNEKLWIVSKHAPVFANKAKAGEGLDVGEVTQICYETAKTHVGNGKTFEYVHEFGEDGGKRPHLIVDHEGMPILRGGDYKIRAEGIVN